MIVVIGAGVVGLAVAQELAADDEVLIVERNHAIGLETSSHNSGVIHAGLYYPTGSLKHRLCIEGNALLYEWAAARGVRHKRTGKLVIAVDAEEEPALEGVWEQATRNGVRGLRWLTRAEVADLEPSVRCHRAFFSETSGVIDQIEYARSLLAAARERGALLALRHEVVACEGSVQRLRVRDGEGQESVLEADIVINAAGLGADHVAERLGYDVEGGGDVPRLRQTLNKGRYYDLVDREKARRIRHLVYPVPDHRAGGLGVHITVDVDGGVHFGPDTEWLTADALLDYRADDLRRDLFWTAAVRYLPDLAPEDLAPGQVGYRPKLQRPGEDIQDFLVWRDGPYIHLGGIESPGLTASLAIARYVRALLH